VTNATPATDVTFGSYIITGAIKRQINTTTLLAMTVTAIHEDNAAWDVQAVADDTTDALVIEVYPENDCPKWSASVILNELTVGP
jgi:hypothetical protein